MPDHPEALFYLDWLKTLAEGMPLELVTSFFTDPADMEWMKQIFNRGFSGGVSQWKKLNTEKPHAKIGLMVSMFSDLARRMTISELHGVFKKYSESLEKTTGTPSSILMQFAEETFESRDFLKKSRMRLSKWIEIFEEWLAESFRKESFRMVGGVHMVSHGVHLPNSIRFSYCLSSQALRAEKDPYDLWNWNSGEFQFVWAKFHSIKPWKVQKRTDKRVYQGKFDSG